MLSRHPLPGVLVRALQPRGSVPVPLYVRPVEHMQPSTACGSKVPDKEVGDRGDSRRHILRPSPTRLCSLLQQARSQVRVWKLRQIPSASCESGQTDYRLDLQKTHGADRA